MENCDHEPPATFCGCESLPSNYEISIGPVEDNGTPGYLKQIDGKWWFICSQGTPVREVPESEIATMGVKW